MRILHVITGMARAAGTSVFCGEVLRQLSERGHSCRLLVRRAEEDFYPVGEHVRVFERRVGAVMCDGWRPHVVHIHALWSPWLLRAYVWARVHGVPVVWSPHGMLTPWALSQGRLKKRVALWAYQRWALRGAALLHVTAPSEEKDVRRLRLMNQTAEIPLGVSVPEVAPKRREESVRTALFLSRVHPKKGLFDLIDAWAALRPKGWRLWIAGPSSGHHAEAVVARARRAGFGEREVRYLGPVYGARKDALYAKASLFILPTYSENFGSVVLEALAQGCPVVTTRETPWRVLEERRCGWWIDVGVASLTRVLGRVLALPEKVLSDGGGRGYSLVREAYAWPSVGRLTETAYQRVLMEGAGGGREDSHEDPSGHHGASGSRGNHHVLRAGS